VNTSPSLRLAACAFALGLVPLQVAAAPGAEIVLLVGSGERRNTAETAWVNAVVRDQVGAGGFVRTLANSQMALLMSDRTQVRLNQNSQLEIKSVTEASQWSESTLRLNTGRAWSQARPQSATEADAKQRTRVRLETPTATIGIRGTDWEVEVEPDGRTRLVLLSGEAEIANAHGALTLAPGEAAVAEAGKAPVRFQLVNPSSRVQWVSAWRPQPQRWLGVAAPQLAQAIRRIESGEYAQAAAQLEPLAARDAAAARLLADLLVYQGELDRAQQVLAPHADGGRGDPLASALLAHVLARQDRLDEAQALLTAGLASHARHVQLLVARGDLAIVQGDAARAREAYLAVLEVEPRNVDAWYGLGVIASERERIAEARAALATALQGAPQDGRARAELAAAETFAGNLAEGQRLLQEVLQREPSNYQALTALGLNRLKSGRTAAALDDFLRAGVIEPRYARAWLYSGVVFYQMGERQRAEQAFNRASQLDARDPIPYVLRSMLENDALDPGAAIASAREAQQRMPFLRSLNQVASNQKGSANLGSALAGFGLEEWAGYYATRAYSPYWGGSHLFLADRYTSKFNKNSELFKGYLTEPTAFGASNRQSTMVAVPGHYARAEAVADRVSSWDRVEGSLTLNGLSVEPVPVAYYANGDASWAQSNQDDSSGDSRNLTLGFGMKPDYRLGLFAFGTLRNRPGELHSTAIPDGTITHRERRADFGMNFKLQPDNQLWLKGGAGRQADRVTGTIFSPEIAAALNPQLPPALQFQPLGVLDLFDAAIEQRDVQFRHAFSAGAWHWSWGLEYSRWMQDGALVTTFQPLRFRIPEDMAVRAHDAYLSARVRATETQEWQIDLFAQDSRVRKSEVNDLDILLTTPPTVVTTFTSASEQRFRELNPRLGFRWEPVPLRTFRAAWQRWRKPASVGTLAPADTLGLAINERLVSPSGRYERARLQFDGEFGSRSFVRGFADHERIDNGLAGRRTAVSDFQLTQLESLRNRPEVFEARSDIEETPLFVEGRLTSAGLALNHLLTKRHSVALRYVYRDSEQRGARTGLAIPYIPRHYADLGSQWAVGGQWLLGANATWRSARFHDERNAMPIRHGWEFGLTAHWESLDKSSLVQMRVSNLLSDSRAGVLPDPIVVLRYAYRF